MQVTQTSLPGMEQLDRYSPILTGSSDLFLIEYEAQPRTLVDPRETTVLTASQGNAQVPTAGQAAPPPGNSSDLTRQNVGGQPVRSENTATASPSQSEDMLTRIATSVVDQQRSLAFLSHLWTVSQESTISHQILVMRELLNGREDQLTSLLDIYDHDSPEVAEAQARILSFRGELAALEAERNRLRDIPLQPLPPWVGAPPPTPK